MIPVASFLTPEREVKARLNDWGAPYPSPLGLDEAFVRQRFASQSFSQSLLRHPDRDFGQWQESAVRTLRNSLILPDALGLPSGAVVKHVDDSHPDYIVEEIEISVTPPLRAPATVVIPRNGAERHPAVMALHSMGGYYLYGREKLLAREGEALSLTKYRQEFYDGHSLQAELARAGFLSIAIDAVNFGERLTGHYDMEVQEFNRWRRLDSSQIGEGNRRSSRVLLEDLLSRTMLALGYSTAALVVTDDVRTIDYLVSRPDVDSEAIGCMGLSFGSFRTNYLAALDPRVKVAVSVCWLSTLAGVVNHNIEGALGFFALPPGFYRHFDLADIVAMAAPKPFLAMSGWRDPMIQPAGIAEIHLFLRQVWEQSGGGDKLGSLLFDTGHVFNTQMQENALAFLGLHLAGRS